MIMTETSTQGNTSSERLTSQLEHIAKMARKSKFDLPKDLDDEFILRKVTDFLGCSPVQSIIFAVIFQLSFKDEDVSVNDIAKYLRCSPIRILDYTLDINQLKRLRLIIVRSGHSFFRGFNYQEYFIPASVSEAIGNMDKSMLPETEKLKLLPLLDRIYQFINEREEGNLMFDDLIIDVSSLLDYNSDLKFVKILDGFDLSENELILYLLTCREILNDGDAMDLGRACNKIFPDTSSRFEMKRDLVKGKSKLIKLDLVKLQDGFFRNDREVLLTDKSLDLLLEQDADVIQLNEKKILGLVKHATIKKQKLFYNEYEQNHLNELTSILQQKNFLKIQKRMKQKNMPAGISILFHGAPGTGKTQSTYQIASQTRRDILMVDISDTKSMWFGESEKRIKAVFTDYKKLLASEKNCPIILFNEADAIFSKRKDVDRSGVGQTENAIQNIILQELEDFEGILIATTNLTFNFDKAFERRFLYKIEFHNPDVATRTLIWKDKIPGLTVEQAGILAEKFEMSGGGIENVVRKVEMTSILGNHRASFNSIQEFCIIEARTKVDRKSIGFIK